MLDLGLAGKVIFCTGAGRGIGREVALGLATQGAYVAVADIDAVAAKDVVDTISSTEGRGLAVSLDVTDPVSVASGVERTISEFGTIGGLYNGAGIAEATAPVHEQTPDVWKKIIAVNLLGATNCIRTIAPIMMELGSGAIVNVASGAGLRATDPGHSPYVASKHAVVGLTKAAALDYGPAGVRVNAIAPGPTRTDLIVNHLKRNPEAEPGITGRILLGRLAEPREVAAMAVFLFSAQASFCTGAVYEVNGGELAH